MCSRRGASISCQAPIGTGIGTEEHDLDLDYFPWLIDI